MTNPARLAMAVRLSLVALCLWAFACASFATDRASARGVRLTLASPQSPDPTRLDSTLMRHDVGNPFSASLPVGALPLGVLPYYLDETYAALLTRGGDVGDYVAHFYVLVPAVPGSHVGPDAIFLGVTHVRDGDGFALALFELPTCTWATWPCGY